MLVQKNVLKKWNSVYAGGTSKDYPSLELVRLEHLHFKHVGRGKVLEYACGTGVNTIHLLKCGYEVTAVDIVDGALQMVAEKAMKDNLDDNLILDKIDINQTFLPYESESFDFIIAMSVLSLLGEKASIDHLLGELRRVLKKDGKIILDINDQDSEFSRNLEQIEENVFLSSDNTGVRYYCLKNADDFKKIVEPYFSITDSGYSAHEVFGRRINEWIISACKNS